MWLPTKTSEAKKRKKKLVFFGLPISSHVNQKLFLTFDCHLILVDVTSWGENTHMVIVCLYFHITLSHIYFLIKTILENTLKIEG